MNKEHVLRVEEWNEFKKTFHKRCQKIIELKNQLDSGKVYHSSDFEDKKKSQLVLAFIEKPINTYRDENGVLRVETQWGCRLIYELDYNGTVSSRINDYDGNSYKLNTYSSASNINDREIRSNVIKFLLVEKNNDKTSQPNFRDKLKFKYFSSVQQKSWLEIIKIFLAQVPIIKQIIKAISDGK